MELEKRGGNPAEIRADETEVRVSGYAAVYNQPTSIGGYFKEVILPSAFRAALARGDDVVFLINHDGLPMARTRSGTLRLEDDAIGLKIDAVLDTDDPDVRSIIPKMRRGDLDKMSFAFEVEDDDWDETTNPPLRSIKQVRLVDVSVVTSPAYEGTSIALRSRENARKANNFNARNRRIAARKARAEQRFRNI